MPIMQSPRAKEFVALLREHELRGLLGLGKIADPTTGDLAVSGSRDISDYELPFANVEHIVGIEGRVASTRA